MRALDFSSRQNEQGTTRKQAAPTSKAKTILEAFEYIVELAENSNLVKELFEKAEQAIKYVTRKLKITPMQAVLLAIFVDRSEDNRILPSEIARYIGCRTTKLLRLSSDIEELEKLNYIRGSHRGDSRSYCVPAAVLKTLRDNKPYKYVHSPVESPQEFFDRFEKMMKEMKNGEQTHESLISETLEMLNDIKDSVFAREIRRVCLSNEDTLLYVFMTHLYVANNDDLIGFHDIDNIFDDDETPTYIKRQFRNHTHPLFDRKLIENVNEDGIARADSYKLTDKAKEEFLCELGIKTIGKSDQGLIKADTLAEKTLIYNPSEQMQIDELSSILSEKRFKDVQARLKKAGMRSGFCCIFYGAPGTGKTETVYQLARQTGRSIMRVDVDKIKSCWIGESEKNIKTLFDRYHNICNNSDIAPILLFNEADAVLGVRMEGASRAVDKMENSIQNIILQEMESLDGIMIATTNLTTNLDKAFERRFLYKIRFDKPTLEGRSKIWQTLLKGLSRVEAETLASQFDLSGGEIENIARRHTVNAILSGNESVDIDEIIKLCKQERIYQSNRFKIGF